MSIDGKRPRALLVRKEFWGISVFLIFFPALVVWGVGGGTDHRWPKIAGMAVGCSITTAILYLVSKQIPKDDFEKGFAIIPVVLGAVLAYLALPPKDLKPQNPPDGPAGPVVSDSTLRTLEDQVGSALTRANVHSGAGNFEDAEQIVHDAHESLEKYRGHPKVDSLAARLSECERAVRQQVYRGCNP
jgi:hypothetical protein